MTPRRCTYDDATHGACQEWATRRLTVRCHGRARGVVCEHVLTHGVEASVENIEADDDTAGRVIDAAAPWLRRLTAVVVRGTEVRS